MDIRRSDKAYAKAEELIEEVRHIGATRLSLTGLGLKALPESLGQLTQLQTLDLSGNALTALPDWLGQLMQLQELDLRLNRLTALPESLGRLTQLQALYLSDNILRAPPESLDQLTQLRELYLSRNVLRALPESLGKLSRLQTLNIHGNVLTTLPESLGKLSRLQTLGLSRNVLTTLPPGLRHLARLEELLLHDNPELGLPPEILGPTWDDVVQNGAHPAAPQAILDYYFRIHPPGDRAAAGGIPSRPLNEAKVILVGQGSVGKTSLVNRIVHGTFDPNESKTDGININKEWGVAGRDGGARVQINFWDFGGQEVMHATHQFFLTRRTVYLLVLDARKGENECNVAYWLKMIHSFGGDSPVLVVTNKCEMHHLELNETRLRKDYPNIRGFLTTSCETAVGIEELKAAIAEEVRGEEMGHVYDLLPGEYFAVKEELEALAGERDRIDLHEYYGLCERHGLPERAEQARLLRFLHDLGSVLNFDDPNDPYALRDTNVLNPEWVTAGVYKVLNDATVATRGGVVTRADLRRLLDPKTHPDDCHEFIMEMMRKFELCFVVQERQQWLVPELLHVNEPDLEWPFADALNFEYYYPDVLPPGIICRFITRRYRNLTRKPTYWRSGVVLELDGCRALVRSDTDKGRMFISVSGPEKQRRGALAVIRDEFRAIHATVPKLAPKEMVPLPDQREVTEAYAHLLKLEAAGEDSVWPQGAARKYSVAELLDGIADKEQRDKERRMAGGDHIEVRVDNRGGSFQLATGGGNQQGMAGDGQPARQAKRPGWWWPAVAAFSGLGVAGWAWLLWAIPNPVVKALLGVAGVVFVLVLKQNPAFWYRRMAALCVSLAAGCSLWSVAAQVSFKIYGRENPIVEFAMDNSPPAWPAVAFLVAGCFFGWLSRTDD